MNNITMSIPKLTGRENWSTWSFAVKAYLQHEDLHNCISAEPNPNDPKAVKDDVKAKSKLILLVDPILYVHIQQAENAKQLWDNLTKAFEDRGLTRKVGLLKDLINTTLETSESVESYVNKIMSSAHKLRNINFNVDDEWLGTLMLAGLPDSYKPMIMGIESSGVKINADLIKTKLLQEVKSIDSDTTVLYTKHNNVKDLQNNPKKGPRCFICNKYGHISKNCKSKKAKQNKNKNTSYVAVFSAATKYDDGFYIDSGASMHLTMRQDWLYDEVPPPITNINIANSKMLPLCQKGKQSRLPFPSEGSRALNPLELIHSDVCGPMEVKSLGGASIHSSLHYQPLPYRALSYATPEEMWSGKKPDVSHLKIFGCEAMVKIPKRSFENWILRQAK
ncbi:Retrovirus-related Pol polyprotein from transposon TNT 1-94 [Eumeta japonica]|uniref:Retrovirus-related Pol polyprotein from transposon TNT 1-94 n=1 Tax=Eumeta variegata TaxID=151549 RepID=A0A4C1YQ94_EUMVA|nr:Retrovirus-related Pol polyprotein from transposon TNT 1-94 [Eumeta japonica]